MWKLLNIKSKLSYCILRWTQSPNSCSWSWSLCSTWDNYWWCNWRSIWQDSKVAWPRYEERWWPSSWGTCSGRRCGFHQIFCKPFFNFKFKSLSCASKKSFSYLFYNLFWSIIIYCREPWLFFFFYCLVLSAKLYLQIPMRQHKDCNFSYAGLKTQVRLAIESRKM